MTTSRRYDAQRRADKPSRTWYKSKAWKARRKDQLKAHPMCQACDDEGVTRMATIVDHYPRHGEDYTQFFQGPVRSLCKPHHDSQAQSEEARGYSPQVGLDGWPVDTQHPFNRKGPR